MANLKMPEDETADFISKKVDYMIQAMRGALTGDAKADFVKLSTDAERFAFMWAQTSTHDIIALEPEFCGKSTENARSHREKGNEYFQKKSYLTALREYNVSILSAPQTEEDWSENKADSLTADDGKPEHCAAAESEKTREENGDVKPTDDSTGSVEEQKSNGDGNKETKASDKNELALAYANRSAALLHLKRYKECLRDIELSLEAGYPVSTQYKLYDRQGAAYLATGNTSDATASFQKALDNLLVAGLSPKATATWQASIGKQLENCQKAVKAAEVKDSEDPKMKVPALTGERNEKYRNASVAVKVSCDATRGRHTVASRDVKVGDVVMREDPFVAVMLPGEYAGRHCYRCFAVTEAPVPCRRCVSVMFCSRECRDEAWQQYHWAECSFGELLTPSMCGKIGHLAARLVMCQAVGSLLAYSKSAAAQSTDPEQHGFSAEGVYDPSSYDSVYHLTANAKLRTSDDLFEFTVLACVLVKIMIASGFLKEIAESTADLDAIGGFVLRHLQIVQCNAFRVIELSRPTKFDEPKPEPVGVALYPTAALINHSCDPNADLNFYGNTVVVRAIRNISEGEEICISYGPVFYEVKPRLRHKQLKGVYFFNCK